MTNKTQIGTPITWAEAIERSRKIMEHAEEERKRIAEEEAKHSLFYEDTYTVGKQTLAEYLETVDMDKIDYNVTKNMPFTLKWHDREGNIRTIVLNAKKDKGD